MPSQGSDTAKGAATGAALGATVGSAVPAIGTAIGAGVGAIGGGLVGYFGHKKKPKDKLDQFNLRANPQLGNRDYLTTQYRQGYESAGTGYQNADIRARQIAAADRLQAIMSGQQQGAGELAAQRGGNRAIAQQFAAANMQRGVPWGGREAARNVADIGTTSAGQQQIAALQDQQAASGQLGEYLSQTRAADLGERQAQDQARLAYLAQLFGISQAEMEARLNQDRLRVQREIGHIRPDTPNPIFPAIIQGAGGILAARAGASGGGGASS